MSPRDIPFTLEDELEFNQETMTFEDLQDEGLLIPNFVQVEEEVEDFILDEVDLDEEPVVVEEEEVEFDINNPETWSLTYRLAWVRRVRELNVQAAEQGLTGFSTIPGPRGELLLETSVHLVNGGYPQ